MKQVFADTYFYLALLSEDDEGHDLAAAFSKTYAGRVLTINGANGRSSFRAGRFPVAALTTRVIRCLGMVDDALRQKCGEILKFCHRATDRLFVVTTSPQPSSRAHLLEEHGVYRMETSLHRELKLLYAGRQARYEVSLDGYRIDAIARGRLIEIQHGALGAIRDKIRDLLQSHRVTIVKPIVASKTLVKKAAKGGEVLSRRTSPKRGQILDLFDELVHFTNVFPNPGLTLEVLLVEIEESRYPGHGRRRRWRADDHEVEDQRLVAIRGKHRLRTADDLARLVRCPQTTVNLPAPFHTAHLADSLGVRRWAAQRIVYCLQRMGSLQQVGKEGNARLYEFN